MGYGAQQAICFPFRVAAALFLGIGFLYMAYAVARVLAPRKAAPIRPAAVIVAGLWIATALFHLLMAWRRFFLPDALLAVAVGALCARVSGYTPSVFRRQLVQDAGWLIRTVRLTGRSRVRLVVFSCLGLIVVAATRTLLIPPIAWDAVTYHAVKSGIWVQQGSMELFPSPGGWGEYYRSMFGGGELLTSWAMLPFHSDLVAVFNDALLWIALGLVMYALARALGARARFAWPVAIFSMSIPAVCLAVGAVYVEAALNVALMGGLVFGVRFARRRAWRDLLLSALGFGLAAGVKILAWPAIFLCMLVLLVLALSAGERRLLLGWYVVGVLAAAVTVIPWVELDVQETGRLLGDLPIRLGPLMLGRASPTVLFFSQHPELEPYALATEWGALRKMFLSPVNPSVHVSVIGLVAAAAGLMVAVRALYRRAAECLLLLALAGGTLAFFYHPSFTPSRLIWSNTSSRFLISLLLPLIAMSACACRSRASAVSAYAVFLWLGAFAHLAATLFHGWAWCEFKGFALLTVPLLAVAVIVARAPRVRGAAARCPLAACFVTALLVLVPVRMFRTPSHRYKVAIESVVMHDMPRTWVEAARAMDRPSRPKRIAVTAASTQNADNWFLYFFLGRDLQNTLLHIPVGRDGSILDLPPDCRDDPRTDVEAWYRRLAENRVDAIMCFWHRPLELRWLEDRRAVYERLAGYVEEWGLYWVRPRPGTTYWLDDR